MFHDFIYCHANQQQISDRTEGAKLSLLAIACFIRPVLMEVAARAAVARTLNMINRLATEERSHR
jgi:hypothetical protein